MEGEREEGRKGGEKGEQESKREGEKERDRGRLRMGIQRVPNTNIACKTTIITRQRRNS